MTTEEFIAWFDGFTGRMKGRPNAKDWAAIIDHVARIDGHSPLKAWFEGLRVKVKGVPSEDDWRQIKARIGTEQSKAEKFNRLRDPFASYDKKSAPAAPRETKVRYPGASPFGKKKLSAKRARA